MSWWRRLLEPADTTAPDAPGPFAPLEVLSAGLCCSVGHELAAANCALRANMDHFHHSRFTTPHGDRLLVAQLPDETLWGQPRLVQWLSLSTRECLATAELMQPGANIVGERCAVVILMPEQTAADDALSVRASAARMVRDTAQALGVEFHPASTALPGGRAAVAEGLQMASRWLAAGQVDGHTLSHVLLLAADSLLDADRIDTLLAQRRLFCTGNLDGFIPGEAAAALLLAPAGRDNPTPQRRLLITGAAHAIEPARWDGETPNRSTGLTQAVREACRSAQNVTPADLRFRLSDQNGETFYAKEATNAFTRLRSGASPATNASGIAHLTLADKIGDVGAAHATAGLAWLWELRRHGQALPGDPFTPHWGPGLLHAAADGGLRAAVIVETR